MPDRRLPLLGAAAWGGVVLGGADNGRWFPIGPVLAVLLGGTVLIAIVLAASPRGRRALVGSWLSILVVLVAAVGALLGARAAVADAESMLRDWARQSDSVVLDGELVTDPTRYAGRFGSVVRYELAVRSAWRPGLGEGPWTLGDTVAVVAARGPGVIPGAGLRLRGQLQLDDRGEPVLRARTAESVDAADPLERLVHRLRSGVRYAAAGLPEQARTLVPALVDGDTSVGIRPTGYEEDFRTAGMTHLLAVSGSNLTLVVGSLMSTAREN